VFATSCRPWTILIVVTTAGSRAGRVPGRVPRPVSRSRSIGVLTATRVVVPQYMVLELQSASGALMSFVPHLASIHDTQAELPLAEAVRDTEGDRQTS